MNVGNRRRWIHDPSSKLCRPLNCKEKELCLLEDTFTAVCVSKKELHKSGCQECPVGKPMFLCGSDNRTYSSPCRLEYHNCIHHTSIRIACKGFCPCKAVVFFPTRVALVVPVIRGKSECYWIARGTQERCLLRPCP